MSRKMRIHSKHLSYGDPFTDNQRARIAKQLLKYLNERSPKLPPLAQAIAVLSDHENLPRKTKKQLRQLALMDLKLKLVSYLPIIREEEITEMGMSMDFYIDRIQRITDRASNHTHTRRSRSIF